MDLQLEGRVVVCTGALGAIGAATARALADEGARLFLVDRDEGALQAQARELPGASHLAHACDLGDPDAPAAAIDRCTERAGRLDGLVHLAAVMIPRDLEDVDAELWDLHQQVNVRGTFLVARAAGAAMAAGDGGRILLASSGAWLSGGLPDRLHYATSKGAVTTMVRGLARTLGPRGVAVNAVAPGMVDSPMMRSGLEPGTRGALERETPLRRFGQPEEIASVIAFLISPRASFVSGATLVVSGGLVLH